MRVVLADGREILVRELNANADLHRVPRFEQGIWHNPDPIPDSVLRVLVDHGGAVWVAAVAKDPDDWVGFAVALAARDSAGWYLHSHMAGVLDAWRSLGVGRHLKARQRQWARQAGYVRIGWTFDPLRARNARFNLEHLGARVVDYHEDYYGVLESSLNHGYPSDRLFVEWPVNPSPPQARSPGELRRIAVPKDIGAVLRQAPEQAQQILLEVRQQFQQGLRDGWSVAGFEWSDTPCYVLHRSGDGGRSGLGEAEEGESI